MLPRVRTPRMTSQRFRRAVLGFTTGCLVLVGAACASESGSGNDTSPGGSDSSDQASTNEITIRGLKFQPQALTVAAGTEVTWVNEDNVDHTVTSGRQKAGGVPGVNEGRPAKPDGIFNEILPGTGDTVSVTFDEQGTYAYFCEIHAAMTGEIVVE